MENPRPRKTPIYRLCSLALTFLWGYVAYMIYAGEMQKITHFHSVAGEIIAFICAASMTFLCIVETCEN